MKKEYQHSKKEEKKEKKKRIRCRIEKKSFEKVRKKRRRVHETSEYICKIVSINILMVVKTTFSECFQKK